MTDSDLIIRPQGQSTQMVEVCRSYAHKVNCANWGGPQFESRDFFASRKASCEMQYAEDLSESLYQACRAEVVAAVTEYVNELKRRAEMRRSA